MYTPFMITSYTLTFESNDLGIRLNNNFVEDDIFNMTDKEEIVLCSKCIPILISYPVSTKQIFYIDTTEYFTRNVLASKITLIYDMIYNNREFYFNTERNDYPPKDSLMLMGLKYFPKEKLYSPIINYTL
jgi:hypothetical protein